MNDLTATQLFIACIVAAGFLIPLIILWSLP